MCVFCCGTSCFLLHGLLSLPQRNHQKTWVNEFLKCYYICTPLNIQSSYLRDRSVAPMFNFSGSVRLREKCTNKLRGGDHELVWDMETGILSGFSFFEFDQIQEATGNFSEENKLGEGGFGPVCKVHISYSSKSSFYIK